MSRRHRMQTFTAVCSKVANADYAVIRLSHFADAAFIRSCGTYVVATQRVSSFQPFMGAALAGTKTALSLHAVQTNKTRTIQSYADAADTSAERRKRCSQLRQPIFVDAANFTAAVVRWGHSGKIRTILSLRSVFTIETRIWQALIF